MANITVFDQSIAINKDEYISLTDIAKYKEDSEAIELNLIPKTLTPQQISHVYASEADILNVALFGKFRITECTLYPRRIGAKREASKAQYNCYLADANFDR